MRFSPIETGILKRMAALNPSLTFNVGNKIWSNTHPVKIFMCMNLDEPIDVRFDVVDLSNFIQTMSLMDSEKLQVKVNENDPNIYITDMTSTAQVVKANPAYVKVVDKCIDIQTADVEFNLSVDDFKTVKRAIQVVDGKQVFLKNTGVMVHDEERKEKSKFLIKKDFSNIEFNIPFDAEMVRIISDNSYKVTVQFRTDQTPALVKFEDITGKYYYLMVETVLG